MLIGFFFFFVFLILSLYWIKQSSFFYTKDCPRKLFFLGFGFKFFSALALWFVYTYIYNDRPNADIYKYFDDATYIFEATKNNLKLRYQLLLGLENISSISGSHQGVNYWDSASELLFNDNRTMIRLHLTLYSFSRGFYLVHILFFTFLSFIGSMGLFRFFKHFSTLPSKIVFAISFLPPSLLFWSSAPLKESYLLFSLGIFLFGVSKALKCVTAKAILFVLIGILLLLTIKLYILLSIIPTSLLVILFRDKKITIKPLIAFSLTLLLCILISQDFLVEVFSNKQIQFKELAIETNARSTIRLQPFNNLTEYLMIQPQALFNAFVRPLWPPHWNILTLMTAIEHLFYLGILILPFLFKRKTYQSDRLLILYSATFLIIAGSIIGSTTPILGAIVRYKSPLIPFYLMLVFTLIDFPKLIKSKQ